MHIHVKPNLTFFDFENSVCVPVASDRLCERDKLQALSSVYSTRIFDWRERRSQ